MTYRHVRKNIWIIKTTRAEEITEEEKKEDEQSETDRCASLTMCKLGIKLPNKSS